MGVRIGTFFAYSFFILIVEKIFKDYFMKHKINLRRHENE